MGSIGHAQRDTRVVATHPKASGSIPTTTLPFGVRSSCRSARGRAPI